ncbi:MAG: hypothetical protein LC730_04650, partial [Acidobacteria bacterium]|nr:hypothetical protein [Acidobacteriota bacterium]
SLMSTKSLELAQMASGRQGKSIEGVLENGFTATTFAPSLPEIRDERVKGEFGAIEVYNSKDGVWEDLPFVVQDGKWKFAVGDLFAGSFKSPGKGLDVRQKEAANAANPIKVETINTNVPVRPGKAGVNRPPDPPATNRP